MQEHIRKELETALSELGITDIPIEVEHPADPAHGDYSTNVALIAGKKLGKNPREVAEEIVSAISDQSSAISKIDVAGAGFINFHLSTEYLLQKLQKVLENDIFVPTDHLRNKKFMVEYAHPNTHKEMHIGHMRTLITGEAIARLLEAAGATVFRANYQGDIGPHVAKAIWGIQKLMSERNLTLEEIGKWPHAEKAHFLGEGYAKGSQEYDTAKEDIDTLNTRLYQFVIASEAKQSQDTEIATSPSAPRDDIASLYQRTRQWSLDYYEDFYKRFYTKFDRLFFESEMVEPGKRIVMDNIGKVFKEENGAIIFKGEEYGLHTRVFITSSGNPTYEGKEMGNGFAEHAAFPFDTKIHVVGSEQAGYFQVVFKALELIDPEKFAGKQHHVSMGMVTLTDRKMSSRTGDILRVDWLLDEVKKKVDELFSGDRVSGSEKEEIAEQVTVAAVKYSVLRVGTGQNVAFSIDKSVTLDGDSGPYLQYTFVRTQSVLSKGGRAQGKEFDSNSLENDIFEAEELSLLRFLAMFEEVVIKAAERYNPSVLTTYLFELAQAFNLFYQKHSILSPVIASEPKQSQGEGIATDPSSPRNDDIRTFRLALTEAVGKRIHQGLDLLGIKTPEKM